MNGLDKNNGQKTALKVTAFYVVFGLLFVLFQSNSDKSFLINAIQGTAFLVLTAILFYFLLYFFLKRSDSAVQESAPIKPSAEDIRSNLSSVSTAETEELYKKAIAEKEKAELMNNTKTQFLANMSQEIRTPMSGIIGMTELMMLTNPTKEQKEYLDIINFSSSTLLAIINDILDFSRIETGTFKLEQIDFNIRELVNKTSQILDFDARRKNLALNVNIQESINYNISGDPLRINQILINLLKNAVKYTERGSVNLLLEEREKAGGKVTLRFVVSDTGIGIKKEKMLALFGETTGDGLVNQKEDFVYTGIGFGIPIVHHLITIMGGQMRVTSKDNSGTTFTIDIPFSNPSDEEPVTITTKSPEKKITSASVNILVAEDNIVNQRLVKELLTRKNYNVTIVENGLKIFDILEHNKFDVILMDIQMPIMDGLEATSIIREIEKGTGRHTPIIGITAYTVKADKDKCLSAGMDDYMSKPFVKEEFYNMINKYIK